MKPRNTAFVSIPSEVEECRYDSLLVISDMNMKKDEQKHDIHGAKA